MLSLVTNKVKTWLAAAGAIVLAVFLAFVSGKRAEKRASDIQEKETALEQYSKREKIDDEVRQSNDLVDRARRAGIVREDS